MGEFEKSCVNCGVLNCAKRDKEYPEFCLTTNIVTRPQLVPAKVIISFPQNAVMRIDIPADAINATTAGRKEPNTP